MGAIAFSVWLAAQAAADPAVVEPGVADPPVMIAAAAKGPAPLDRGLAAASAGLGAAAGHVLGVSTALGGYGVLATAGVPPLVALLPTLVVPPLCAAAGAAAAALPFTSTAGALGAGGAALLADGVATGVSSLVFLYVLSLPRPPNRAIDGAVLTLLIVPAIVSAAAGGTVAAFAAQPPDEAGP